MSAAKTHKKRLVLLDAHAIIHRAYHALPDFSTTSGEPTGALYGLSTMLIKLIGDLKPDFIAACFDLPSPTHRHDAYEGYKATRKKIDDELISQLERSKEIFKAFGIPIYSLKGFEADDVLGTIVEKFKKDPETEIIIASGDMDTLQLVSGSKVRVYTLRKGITDTVTYDEAAVLARYGFGPKHIPDYKGLSGDPSDNIIGVPGIGEKTATILIQNFGTVEEIYNTLKKDRKILLEKGIKERVVALLEAHEDEARFSKMLATVRSDAPVDFSLPDKKWSDLVDIALIEKLFKDLEFRTLLDRFKTMITMWVGAATIPEENISPDDLEKTKLALWVVDSTITDPDVKDILNYAKADSFEEAKEIIFAKLKEGRTRQVYEEIEIPLMPIIKKMKERGVPIDKEYLKKLSKEYHKKLNELEKKILKFAGEEFNINSPKQLSKIIFEKMAIVGVGKGRQTAGGVRSTKESELEKIKDLHPIIPLILEYRELQKLLSTYIDNIPERLGADGRLHASFVQTGSTTGRLSSKDPNLQNIPIKTELGKRIRNAFIAEDGFSLVAFDYSQIELRIAAFLSHDKKLIEIFRTNGDIHTGVAAEVFNVPKDKVDYEMRRRAKIINFGIIYGMGVNALRTNLGTTREEAKHFYDEYFKNFDGLAKYIEEAKKLATTQGYTETFFGRRRYFPELRSKLPFIRASGERMAVNAPFQGTSADLIKLSMIKIDKLLGESKLEKDAYLILTVHDELVYEIRESVVRKIVPAIKKIMEEIILPAEMEEIPLIVKASAGKNWGEMKEI